MMKKEEKLIMVVKRDSLFKEDYFEGFKGPDGIDYNSRILENFEYIKRNKAEGDSRYKQPIAYCIIVNPASKHIFAYQRSRQEMEYTERRLSGKWSWGVGGHIEKIDTKDANPIFASMSRELKEEVEIDSIGSPKLLGYINDDNDDVGRVHFGILYVLEVNSDIVKPKDSEVSIGRLATIEELEKICLSSGSIVEDWSRISLDPLKSYFREIKVI
jgi:predicted NUDIX family phosphoesterase